MPKDKYHSLSIMLLKDGYQGFDQAIKADGGIREFPISDVGRLYVKSSIPKPPSWFSFFNKHVNRDEIGINTSVGAVLLVEVDKKIFAISFGHGRYILESNSWVDRFGLKVALNSIGKEKIRTIDKVTFDAISRQSKEQASKETDARDFGMDVEQDLLRAVTGIPKHSFVGKKIYGMDSLSVSTNTDIAGLKAYLSRILLLYNDDSYKKDFPWVDNINEVKDNLTIDKLDDLLVANIKNGDLDKIWMAVPEIIEWEKVDGFCYKIHQNSPEHNDIHLPDFLDSLSTSEKEDLSKEILSKKYVNCIDTEGYLLKKWKAFNCLYGEMDTDEETYVLNNGKWYLVDNDFVNTVNKYYEKIPDYDFIFPKYCDDSEGCYNTRISKELDDFVLMDRGNISYGGGHSQIEFCDLLSRNKDIIHVKRYGSSSVLSHLFAQGRLSGELFQMEEEFRKKVQEKLPEEFTLDNLIVKPKSDEYQVVFAIISDAPGKLTIPFFSRLNLKNSVRNLRGLGYRVSKSKIDVSEEKIIEKKYKRRKKKR